MRALSIFGILISVALGLPIAAQAQNPAGAAPDVCTLLPRDEALKLLGRKEPARTRSVKRTDGDAMECRYMIGSSGNITVMVGAGVSKPTWDENMKILRSSGAALEAASGVGDGAFFWDTRLYAHTATYEITVSHTPTPGDVPAKIKADAITLAKAIVAKLKR